MKKFGFGIVAAAALFSTSGHAATLIDVDSVATTQGTFNAVQNSNDIDASFTTSGGDASGSFRFEVDSAFRLVLTEYTGTGSSGYGLRSATALSGGSVGAGILPDAGSSLNCSQAAGSGATCDRFGSNDGSTPVSTLFSFLSAGVYEFAFWEGNNAPTSSNFTLNIAEVPVPAAGVLFGSALLGAAALRRRKLQQKLGLPS